MQTNRIIALILVVVCFVAAIVGGVQRQAQKTSTTFNLASVSKNRLEVVRLNGAIDGSTSVVGALAVRNRLLKLQKEDNVKGVLVTINSPGGTVAASKELYEAIRKLREKKPVYVSMLDVAASGGYYAASAADQVYANGGTLTGSIGVILSGFNLRQLLDRVGIEPQTIKTGPFKDILSPYRKLSPQERQLLQQLAQNVYEQFLQDVAKGRKLEVAAVREVADGRVFTGTQAKTKKLVDVIGTEADAEVALREAARERFNLDKDIALPLEESPGSFQRTIEQLFEGRAFPLFSLWDGFPRQAAPQPIDPPLLLLPSWMTDLTDLSNAIEESKL